MRGAGRDDSGRLAADILNAVDDAFFVLDREWRLVYATRSLCELVGHPQDELLGKSLPSVMPWLEGTSAQRTIAEAIGEGRGGVALDAWGAPAEEGRWREMTVSVFGQGVLCVSRDVTQREKIRAEIENKNALMETFVNNIPDMAWVKDRNSKFIIANKAFCDTVGMAHEFLVNNTCDVCFGELAVKFKADDRAVMESKTQKRIEESIVDANQKVAWLETIKSPLRDGAGVIVGTVGIARDITERKRLNAALNTASRLGGMAEVAIGVLHNVGNAINSVNVSTSLVGEKLQSKPMKLLTRSMDLLFAHKDDLVRFLTDDPAGKALMQAVPGLSSSIVREQQEMIAEMDTVRLHLGQIMQTIQRQEEYARVTSVVEKCSLDQVIDEALAFVVARCKELGIQVKTEIDEMLDLTQDRNQIVQILANLMRNAVDALADADQPEKLIGVVGHRHGDERFRIEVSDNGTGINEEDRPAIFRYGFSTKPDGRGFSLHNSSALAHAMGGALSFSSDGRGRGSVFCLELPIQDK
ncbi:MAG TPA: PAS domain-containing sensor histidine kinase [Kofleriaceae bacterium]|nr:PAS domain-containing sensor histidine kinase [Kofleriaceae bacterium]